MKNTICLVIRQTDVFVFYTKLVSIPTFQKNFQKIFTKVLTNTCSAIYNKTLSQESHNWIHIFTEFWRTVLRRTRLRYAKRKYRRFWNCFELPAIRKHDRQFRLWISKPVTTEWPTEWDMILRQPLFSESKRNNAAWDEGRDRKTTFRQTGGKQQTVYDRKSVAYHSKQGNCIDSFRPNRL